MGGKATDQAKRHHYIPQFYLRRFADQKGRLRAYRRVEHKSIPKMSAENAAVEVGFYNLVDAKGQTSDEAEQLLSQIEAQVAPAMKEIVADWPPDPDTRLLVAQFAALQFVRTRELRHQNSAQAAELARTFKDLLGDKFNEVSIGEGPPIPVDQLEEALRPDHNQAVLMPLTLINQLTPMLAGRFWSLLETKKRTFITSDAPVQVTDVKPRQKGPFQGIGLGTADLVFLPLDPHHTLLMWAPDEVQKPGGALPVPVPTPNALAKSFAQRIADTSYEWIFADPRSKVLDEIELPRGPRPVGQIAGMGQPLTDLWGPGHKPTEDSD